MVQNAITFFYPGESSISMRDPQILDNLPTRSQEIILANMKKSVNLTLGVLKSLYPQANFDTASESFTATYSDDEALKLVKDFAVTARHIVDMLLIDMSLGYCHTPFRERGNKASIRVPRMFKSHAWQQLINRCNVINK
jgi:hypothetical protein